MNSIPITELTAPFNADQVKQRRGSFGKELAYIEAHNVIARLNDVLDGRWSFQIVQMEVEPDEVIIRGRLTIGDTVREQFGGSKITRHRDTGEIMNLADDLKSAASDALKKCASLAGVALSLYSDSGNGTGNGNSTSQTNGRSNGNGQTNGTAGSKRGWNHREDDPNANARVQSPRVSNDQIARIVQTAKDAGMPQKDVIQLSRDTYGATLSQLSPDQADELITLIAA
ncbi:RAD52 family DNA repair protein [bacterium]|nr:RAD52 family DNA repair protein [bacterium]